MGKFLDQGMTVLGGVLLSLCGVGGFGKEPTDILKAVRWHKLNIFYRWVGPLLIIGGSAVYFTACTNKDAAPRDTLEQISKEANKTLPKAIDAETEIISTSVPSDT